MGNKSEHVTSSETETESRREKVFRFNEEVDNSEKMPGMEKNYVYQEMVYCTGSNSPIHSPFVLGDAAEKRPNSLCMII